MICITKTRTKHNPNKNIIKWICYNAINKCENKYLNVLFHRGPPDDADDAILNVKAMGLEVSERRFFCNCRILENKKRLK